jgi:hypothetical protein
MVTINSVGKCLFCNKEFSKAAIGRHLGTHLTQKSKEGTPGISYHIKIEEDTRGGGSPYFLNLWVDGDITMNDIDDFLRAIWLECCGHMSGFTNPKEKKGWVLFDEDEADELMETETKDMLSKGLKLKYDYDYGSTTKLILTVLEQYPVELPNGIELLSRNEPLEIMCDTCETEPATQICAVCWNGPNTFCKKCAKKHAKTCDDFAEYAAMPVVNSPRMGVCAYTGGKIDKDRDGVFVKK